MRAHARPSFRTTFSTPAAGLERRTLAGASSRFMSGLLTVRYHSIFVAAWSRRELAVEDEASAAEQAANVTTATHAETRAMEPDRIPFGRLLIGHRHAYAVQLPTQRTSPITNRRPPAAAPTTAAMAIAAPERA